MNREDIIRMAREAGFVLHAYPQENWLKLMERFAALVAEWGAKQEREACAKVCDGWLHADGDDCAAAILARGEQEKPR